MIGQRFGSNIVISRHHGKWWNIRCDCGYERQAASDYLKKAPGCRKCNDARRLEQARQIHRPTWNSWLAMRQRCRNPNNTNYSHYGGRGITIAERWDAYSRFLADMGERLPGTSLDRIDNDGNYEPGNCRWASRKTQSRNQRRAFVVTLPDGEMCAGDLAERLGMSRRGIYGRVAAGYEPEQMLKPRRAARRIEANGRSLTIAEWADDLGISAVTISTRLTAGWSEERAVTTPLVVRPGNSPRQLRRMRTGK